ncbi:MAG TPA: aldo/keto reductase [Ignavibacteria bacterium]|nr:aldo/keto reductase [Ignavibacteria bacterium]
MNFTLGTAQLGLKYGIANKSGKPTKTNAVKIIKTAESSGVRYYDTASAYGNSEQLLGDYFQNKKSDAFIVTKLPPILETLKNQEDEIEIIEKVILAVESSKRNLKSETIDCLMFHRTDDYFLNEKLIINYLYEHKKKLNINTFGISLYSADETEELLNDERLTSYQVPANLLDHRFKNKGFLKTANDFQNIVFIRSIFLQGLFFLDDSQIPENIKEFIKYKKLLSEIIKKSGFTFEQFTVNFFKTFYKDCKLIFGVDNIQQLNENIKLYNNSTELDDEYLNEILEITNDIPETIINPTLWAK